MNETPSQIVSQKPSKLPGVLSRIRRSRGGDTTGIREVRPIEKKDVPKFLRLFRGAMHRDMQPAEFEWKYSHMPAEPKSIVGFSGGDLIAHFGLRGCSVQLRDREGWAAQAIDVMRCASKSTPFDLIRLLKASVAIQKDYDGKISFGYGFASQVTTELSTKMGLCAKIEHVDSSQI